MAHRVTTRYFVHFAAPTDEDAHDKMELHGRVREMVLHADPHGGWVYGSAEVELHERGTDDGDSGKSAG
jgi:hypothetical protein